MILSLASLFTIPRAPLCKHSPTLLFDTPVNFPGSFFKKWNFCTFASRRFACTITFSFVQKCDFTLPLVFIL